MDKRILVKINNIISLKYEETNELGVLSGISGLFMFKFYYAKLMDLENEYELGEKMINHAINMINKEINSTSYCDGLLGFCWTLQHLSERNMINFECDSFLIGLDELLLKKMKYHMNIKPNYDMLYGAIGFAFYFTKRYKATNNLIFKKKYKNIINLFIDFIEKTAIKDIEGGLKWELLHGKPENVNFIIDFGLAHGTTSVINFLANLSKLSEFKYKVKPMMEEGLFYILKNKIKHVNNLSLFPRSVMEPYAKSELYSRLGWCYGDLGIGITTWKVGKELNDLSLIEEAIKIINHSAKRKSLTKNFVLDSGLCHGAFGISQIFGRMYKNTGNHLFKKSSIYWKRKGLEMAKHNNEYAGFKVYTKDIRDWSDEIGLLEGIAGIGLSIISNLEDFEDDWDECMLIS